MDRSAPSDRLDEGIDGIPPVLPPELANGQSAAAAPVRVVTWPRRRPLGNREWMLIGGAIFVVLAICTISGFVWLGRGIYSLYKEREQPLKVVQV